MKKGFTEVKLAARGARLHLNNEVCKIYVEKASSFFTTKEGIIQHKDYGECVFVPEERIFVPLKDITKIEVPTTRFTPDIMCWMTIAWE